MKKRIVCIAISILCLLAVASFILQLCVPRLSEDYISDVATIAMEKFHVPAVVINVFNSNKTLYSLCEGVRVDGSTDAVCENDYFHIGSCSKSILAYMAAKLVEEGSLDWNTKFFDIYPELKTSALKDYYDITLSDLLSCRAGIKPYTSGAEVFPDLSDARIRNIEFMSYLLNLPPSSGTDENGRFKFIYSNASYTLAAAMLESASHLSYEELLNKFIKEGLGLDVYLGWPYELNRKQPWGHIENLDNTLQAVGPDSIYSINPLVEAAGNLSMTSESFTKYTQLHLQGLNGKSALLKRDTFEFLDTHYSEFSLGSWNETRFGRQFICLDGTAGTYYARGVILPDSDSGFTIMMNCGSEEAAEYISMALSKAQYNWWWMFWI